MVCDDARRLGFDALANGVNFEATLPARVFRGQWKSFFFFQSDWMFDAGFIGAIRSLLQAEKSSVACLLNLTKTTAFKFDDIVALSLDRNITGDEYESFLRGNGPPSGWLYVMDRYACSSEVGEWCIYAEKENDIAVIALQRRDGEAKFHEALERLHADQLDVVSGSDGGGLFPFNQLTREWRTALAANYFSVPTS